MTRTELVLYQNRRLLWMVAALLILGGGVALSLLLIHREVDARRDLADEANLRGTAVSTLAGDVRALRAQVKARGGTPVAPDPSSAVEDLPDRAEVPVPIPGPPGPKGDRGESGKPAPTVTPSPGAPGVSGEDGADSTVPGPVGPQGAPGQDATGAPGQDGKDGANGANGKPPASWTFEYGGTMYTCRPVGDFDPDNPRYACDAPESDPGKQNSGQSPLSVALDLSRRRW